MNFSICPPFPSTESKRLQILEEANILDTIAESKYDRYTTLVARIFKAPIALISLIDKERQWFKSKVGLQISETHRNHAFCSYAILDDAPPVLVVPDATKDSRFQHNPLVTGEPFIRFYAGASIEIEGVKVGTICIIDREPRDEVERTERLWDGMKRRKVFGEKEVAILQDFASIIAKLIRSRREEKLNTIYESLLMNADILKLYRIPLQNLTHSLSELKQKYDSFKDDFSRRKAEDATVEDKHLRVKKCDELIDQSKLFSKQVNRFFPISSSIISLLEEVYQGTTKVDLDVEVRKLSKSLSYMSKMNLDHLKVKMNDYCNIGAVIVTPRIYENEGNANEVKISWAGDLSNSSDNRSVQTAVLSSCSTRRSQNSTPSTSVSMRQTTSPNQIYSYPLLLQLLLMILYDYYDYHHHAVTITITQQLEEKRIYSRNLTTCLQSGQWIIHVDDNQINVSYHESNKNDFHALSKNLFFLLEKLPDCSKPFCHGSSFRERNRTIDALRDIIKAKKSIYEMKIPFYCTVDEDSSKSVPLPGKKSLKVEDWLEETEQIDSQKKLKPTKSRRWSVVSDVVYPALQGIYQQWREYSLTYSLSFRRLSSHAKIYTE
eukprot:gene3011-3198_t